MFCADFRDFLVVVDVIRSVFVAAWWDYGEVLSGEDFSSFQVGYCWECACESIEELFPTSPSA